MPVPWADLSPLLRPHMQDAAGETNGKPTVLYISRLTKVLWHPFESSSSIFGLDNFVHTFVPLILVALPLSRIHSLSSKLANWIYNDLGNKCL